MKSALFVTLGCKLNQSETEQMKSLYEKDGIAYPVNIGGETPEIVVVNGCAVTGKALTKSRHMVSRIVRDYPDSIVVVAGCMAQYSPEDFASIPGVDYVLGTDERFSTEWWQGKPPAAIVKVAKNPIKIQQLPVVKNIRRSRPFLKIQDGCDHGCTYCIIPKLRGNCRSLPERAILDQISRLAERGYDETVLTGVRIGSWGQDLSPQRSLYDLLHSIIDQTALKRVRLGSIEPWELDEKLVELICTHPRICAHLHVPLQHTQSGVLERMGRPAVEGAVKLLHLARRISPVAGLGTDLIVGFPGESDEDFRALAESIWQLPLTYLHTFSFSPREGTKAAEFQVLTDSKAIKLRAEEIINIGQTKHQEFMGSLIGKEFNVIPDHTKTGSEFINSVAENYVKLKLQTDNCVPGRIVRVLYAINSDGNHIGELV